MIKIGTRSSKLALYQSNLVKDKLSNIYPELDFLLIQIKTKGDKIQDRNLDRNLDKGFFVKEIQEQLLNNEIDTNQINKLFDPDSNFCKQLCERSIDDISRYEQIMKQLIKIDPKYKATVSKDVSKFINYYEELTSLYERNDFNLVKWCNIVNHNLWVKNCN